MDLLSSSDQSFSGFLGARSRQLLLPVWQPFGQLRQLQRLYEQSRHLQGREFIGSLLRGLNITPDYDPAELRQLPPGAFVAVASQAGGLLDALVLLYVLSSARPDFRLAANDQLAPLLPHLANQLILAKPERALAGQPMPGVRQLLRYLHNDVPLGLFPAAAPRSARFRTAPAPEWSPMAGRLLHNARVPVVPIWLSGQNSGSVGLLGLMQPWLRTARLPVELLSRQGQTIRIRIGQPVPAAALDALAPFRPLPAPPAGAAETARHLLQADIAALRPSRCLLQSGPWEVYVARTAEIPSVLREIGRLRELTLRAEGEDTGPHTHPDGYDDYHRHLFLYDRAAGRLVGACRLGPGRSLLRQHGKRGFWLHSVFRLKKALVPLLRQSLELGCSFVRAEYQRQPQPLVLLWQGIAEYVARHPHYRYLIGPVRISNPPAAVSRAALVDFLTKQYFDAELAQAVAPRRKFRYRPLGAQEAPSVSQPNLPDLQQLIAGFGPGGGRVPGLLRQYLKQHGQLIGFNLAPASNALNGLLVLDARELPARAHRLLLIERCPPLKPE